MSGHAHPIFACLLILVFACACGDRSSTGAGFIVHDGASTGLDFNNSLTATSAQNIFDYMYFYNGSGVGTADFDGDGLYDLFFAGNQVADRVYRNLGEIQFLDVSTSSGILLDSAWSTGISIVDVNADGLPDVYVSVVGELSPKQVKSGRLYINTSSIGNIRFRESAQEFGLEITGYGTQVAWLDYDRDGDLDAYVLRHSVHKNGTFGPRERSLYDRHPTAGDLFFRNDNQYFTDITDSVGIFSSALGYGLGVVSDDFNADGWPDIYVANDFHEDDYLYLNNQGTGFTEVLRKSASHTSRFSMGVDAADLNGDRFPDLMVLDMLPSDKTILKSSAGEDPYDIWQMKLRNGYAPQYSRNVLQLSKGLLPDSSRIPLYEDLGMLAGVHATDWSWSVLLEDFSLDGLTDIFISNGILGRSNNMDYIKFVTSDVNQAQLKDDVISENDLALANKMPIVKIRNRYFRATQATGTSYQPYEVGPPSFSHGAVSVDLDNDGDRDIVTAEVNAQPQVLENTAAHPNTSKLLLDLKGIYENTEAIGARVTITCIDEANRQWRQTLMRKRVKGFMSSSDPRFCVWIPPQSTNLQVEIDWPEGPRSIFPLMQNTQGDGYQILTQEEKLPVQARTYKRETTPYRTYEGSRFGLDYLHEENRFVEFDRERLVPHMTTEEGPALAVGDVNGDGIDDVFIGSAKKQTARLYLQQDTGLFTQADSNAFSKDAIYEDIDATFLDVDADNDLDLFVLSGGAEFSSTDDNHSPRLYVNDGLGNFTLQQDAIPEHVRLAGSRLVCIDVDEDGVEELLLLPRVLVTRYGAAAEGFVLQLREGKFQDITKVVAPWFSDLSMITDALVVYTEKPYLILARDFGLVTAHAITKNKIESPGLEIAPTGLWSGLGVSYASNAKKSAGKLLLGNLGYNSKLAARGDSTVRMYVADFDGNGTPEQLVTTTAFGDETPFATRDEVTQQMVSLRKKFPDYQQFAESDLYDVASQEMLDKAKLLSAETTSSGWLSFDENGFGTFHPFLIGAQTSSMRVFAKGFTNDMLAFGNTRAVNVQRGTYDATTGWLFQPDSTGFSVAGRPDQSGIFVPGQARRSAHIKIGGKPFILISRSNGPLALIGKG